MLPSGVQLGDSTAQSVGSVDGSLGVENVEALLPEGKHSCPADCGGNIFSWVLWPDSHSVPYLSEHKTHPEPQQKVNAACVACREKLRHSIQKGVNIRPGGRNRYSLQTLVLLFLPSLPELLNLLSW